jgi:hypothetical protein
LPGLGVDYRQDGLRAGKSNETALGITAEAEQKRTVTGQDGRRRLADSRKQIPFPLSSRRWALGQLPAGVGQVSLLPLGQSGNESGFIKACFGFVPCPCFGFGSLLCIRVGPCLSFRALRCFTLMPLSQRCVMHRFRPLPQNQGKTHATHYHQKADQGGHAGVTAGEFDGTLGPADRAGDDRPAGEKPL